MTAFPFLRAAGGLRPILARRRPSLGDQHARVTLGKIEAIADFRAGEIDIVDHFGVLPGEAHGYHVPVRSVPVAQGDIGGRKPCAPKGRQNTEQLARVLERSQRGVSFAVPRGMSPRQMMEPERPDPCGSRHAPSVVVILNSNDDLVELMRVQLETVGFVVVSGHIAAAKRGGFDLRHFVEQHDPCVVVFDLVPPYDRNWMFLEHLRTDPLFQGRQFVLTSANAKHAESLAGRAEHIYEIIGKPYDLDQVVQAVREASRSRPVK